MTREEKLRIMPAVALRGLVVFPDMFIHFDVGREKSINALRKAMDTDQEIFLVTQKDISVDDPDYSELYEIVTQAADMEHGSSAEIIIAEQSEDIIAGFIHLHNAYQAEYDELCATYGYADKEALIAAAGSEEDLQAIVLENIVIEWLAENCVQVNE